MAKLDITIDTQAISDLVDVLSDWLNSLQGARRDEAAAEVSAAMTSDNVEIELRGGTFTPVAVGELAALVDRAMAKD